MNPTNPFIIAKDPSSNVMIDSHCQHQQQIHRHRHQGILKQESNTKVQNRSNVTSTQNLPINSTSSMDDEKSEFSHSINEKRNAESDEKHGTHPYRKRSLNPSSLSSSLSTSTTSTSSAAAASKNPSLRPILVGYAFGPKKMKSMSMVMAEASMAVSTVVTHIPPSRYNNHNHNHNNSNIRNNHEIANRNHAGEKVGKRKKMKQQKDNFGGNRGKIIMNGKKKQKHFSNANNLHNHHQQQQQQRTPTKKFQSHPPPTASTKFDHDDQNGDECSIYTQMEVDSNMSMGCVTTTTNHSSSVTNTTISCIFPPPPINCKTNVGIHHHHHHGSTNTIVTATTSSSSTLVSCTTSSSSIITETPKNNTSNPFSGTYIRIPQHYHTMRVSFVPLDLDAPLEEQHGGKFDAILHKMTEDILCKSQMKDDSNKNSTSTTRTTVESLEQNGAMDRINRLLKYKNDFPACCLVDHPTNVETVMSRWSIAHKLKQCLCGVKTKSGISVRLPRYLVLQEKQQHHQQQYETKAKKSSTITEHDVLNLLENAPFTYPFMIKPLPAAGTADSHRMGILLDRKGIAKSMLNMPCLIQEYVNHDELLYKVYVLGNRVWVFPRPSLPNLPSGQSKSVDGEHHYVDFDSQKPYPNISDFGVVHANLNLNNHFHMKESAIDQTTVTSEEIRPVADSIRQAFGLELFGFDVIVSSANSKTGKQKEMLVVDVNYFPSYKEVTNFSELLAQYLAQCGIEGRVRSFESDQSR